MIIPPCLESYLRISEAIPGWTHGAEARELMRISYSLPDGAELVEIGSFFGAGAVLLAAPRRLRGSGMVHCVDPFDGSGDAFSVPYYRDILSRNGGGSLREHFDRNICEAGLAPWVTVHPGYAADVAATWTRPVDLLVLDGDQSPAGAEAAFSSWLPHLRLGGVIALHNSDPFNHRQDHDGNRRLAESEIKEPNFGDIRLIDSTTFAVKNRT